MLELEQMALLGDQEAARQLTEGDPGLGSPDHALLAGEVERLFSQVGLQGLN